MPGFVNSSVNTRRAIPTWRATPKLGLSDITKNHDTVTQVTAIAMRQP
jgi:hypothetical protein